MNRERTLLAVTSASLLVAAISLGGLIWVIADPHRWIPSAFAQQGPVGDQGPRGAVGPSGPPGPVGPDASAAIDDLSARVDDLATGSGDIADTSVSDLSSALADLETGSGDQAAQSVDDIATTVSALCDAITTEWPYANSATDSLLTSLYNAC
jgi:hypothetical protein